MSQNPVVSRAGEQFSHTDAAQGHVQLKDRSMMDGINSPSAPSDATLDDSSDAAVIYHTKAAELNEDSGLDHHDLRARTGLGEWRASCSVLGGEMSQEGGNEAGRGERAATERKESNCGKARAGDLFVTRESTGLGGEGMMGITDPSVNDSDQREREALARLVRRRRDRTSDQHKEGNAARSGELDQPEGAFVKNEQSSTREIGSNENSASPEHPGNGNGGVTTRRGEDDAEFNALHHGVGRRENIHASIVHGSAENSTGTIAPANDGAQTTIDTSVKECGEQEPSQLSPRLGGPSSAGETPVLGNFINKDEAPTFSNAIDKGDTQQPLEKPTNTNGPQVLSNPASKSEAGHAPADDRMCRICFCGTEDGRLISPCLCKGSMKYVHLACLQHWRSASSNSKSYVQCDTCHFKYHLRRTFIANLLSSWIVLQIVTFWAFVLLLFLSGFIGKILRWLYISYAYDVVDDELQEDIEAYGGVLSWFFLDVYATHWALGAMVVGITGFFTLIGAGFGWPYFNIRRDNGALILVIVVVGMISAFVSLYRLVRGASKSVLAKFEEVVMEVQDDDDAQTFQPTARKVGDQPAT